MVLRAGENVYSAEVESAIYEHGDVYEAAVFGVPHERLGEEVACVILRQPGSKPGHRPRSRTSWPSRWLPSRCRVASSSPTSSYPANASGKILKRHLRDLVLRRRRG